ncbi:hypothetical protein HG536_0D05610 [Torulaspora globosa]|uniref:YbgI/family dinuclear metal center protein n=1 Tax=Torulaspora globosa TaxID=48254 RepID=A0A7G3ZHQ4_9SACH|nr:uncharacterized protein HG536_0D05610 [Torulaspora globosa]QLL33040.1 hypothetical protein HG536_0D05610 [Torulaspora globosa]
MSRAISRTQLQSIIRSITKHYPASYADSTWDNTGLLIDCSEEDNGSSSAKVTYPLVLLTVDLTASVAQEAIDNGCSAIVAYHPFIFPSWKRLNPAQNPQHKSAIRLIQEGISVYCPHTAVDAAKGGVNDWLANGLVGGNSALIQSNDTIEQLSSDLVRGEADNEVGYGRLVKLTRSLDLASIIENVKRSLGIEHLQVASKFGDLSKHPIRTVALCAGSGSGVFKSLREDVDLYYTGELSHHEILRYKEMGNAVIVCNHSNTERGYLKQEMSKLLAIEGINCMVSKADVDPLRVV